MTDTVIYEQPLTERIRLFMRYEQLMQSFHRALTGTSVWHTQIAINNLLSLHTMTSRIDLKSDLLRDIERIINGLGVFEKVEAVNQERLSTVTHKLKGEMETLYRSRGPLGSHLNNHEMFNALRQRAHIPGGINTFDLPQYNHWLSQSGAERISHLQRWIAPYEDIFRSITLLLNLTRESGTKNQITARQGYYQQSLDTRITNQMLRVWLPKISYCYPEISSGKHRFTIRLMHLDNLADRPGQIQEDLTFDLMCCTF